MSIQKEQLKHQIELELVQIKVLQIWEDGTIHLAPPFYMKMYEERTEFLKKGTKYNLLLLIHNTLVRHKPTLPRKKLIIYSKYIRRYIFKDTMPKEFMP